MGGHGRSVRGTGTSVGGQRGVMGGHREVVEGQWETIAIVLSSEILRLFRIQSVFFMLISNSNDHL